MNTKLNIASAVKSNIELSFEYSASNAKQSLVDNALNAYWRHDLLPITAFTYYYDRVDYEHFRSFLAA